MQIKPKLKTSIRNGTTYFIVASHFDCVFKLWMIINVEDCPNRIVIQILIALSFRIIRSVRFKPLCRLDNGHRHTDLPSNLDVYYRNQIGPSVIKVPFNVFLFREALSDYKHSFAGITKRRRASRLTLPVCLAHF